MTAAPSKCLTVAKPKRSGKGASAACPAQPWTLERLLEYDADLASIRGKADVVDALHAALTMLLQAVSTKQKDEGT